MSVMLHPPPDFDTMTCVIRNPDIQRAILVTQQAHEAECDCDFQTAYDLHGQAATLFASAVMACQMSEERRRAKLCLRAATDRRNTLGAYVQGEIKPPEPLPSNVVLTTGLEVTGTVCLSKVETGQWDDFPDEKSEVGESEPFLTPLVPPTLHTVTYHVYSETFKYQPIWIYYHIKDSAKTQTLYTLAAARYNGMQIPVCTMARAAEYYSECSRIIVTPIVHPSFRIHGTFTGRPLTHKTETGTTITSTPDRSRETLWTPRRFTYGRRKFVWKKDNGQRGNWEKLFEIRKQWEVCERGIVNTSDETFDKPLVWCEGKFSPRKVCTIHMVGGLDLLFREFLLADLLTRRLVAIHGVVW